MTSSLCLKTLISEIVSNPKKINFIETAGASQINYSVAVHASDYGRVLGKERKTLLALTMVAALMDAKLQKHVTLALVNTETHHHADVRKFSDTRKVEGYAGEMFTLLQRVMTNIDPFCHIERLENGNCVIFKVALSVASFLVKDDDLNDKLVSLAEAEHSISRAFEVAGKGKGWEFSVMLKSK